MAEVKYTISRTDIENTPKIFIYSKLDLYHTIRIDEEGKETFNGDVSEYMIRNGVDGIPSFEVNEWIDSVESFICDHNDNVYSGEGFDVKFNIISIDSRGAYTYEEIVNGEVVKSGVSWGLDFDMQVETDAWMDAVIKYNKANGIKMPSDKIREKLDSIKKYIISLDNELPGNQGFEMPTISVVLPSFDNDPCEFVSKVKEVSENVVATIDGMPAPKDVINHNIKIVKENIYTTISRTYDAQTEIVEGLVHNTGNAFPDDSAYWEEIDAYYYQMARNEGESEAIFETVIEPPIKYEPIEFTYDAAEPPDQAGDTFLPSNNTSHTSNNTSNQSNNTSNQSNNTSNQSYDIPTIKPWNIFSITGYKEVTHNEIYTKRLSYGRDKNENRRASANIYKAMKYLWVPLRKGWDTYGKYFLIGKKNIPAWVITSGYRPSNFNASIGGAKGSAHIYGYAIDIQLEGYLSGEESNGELKQKFAVKCLYNYIHWYLTKFDVPFDQIFCESRGGSTWDTGTVFWIHIGYKSGGGLTRRQFYPRYLVKLKKRRKK